MPQLARFINEIVLDEESDVVPQFRLPISHAGLYVQAMRQVGADTTAVLAFLESLRHGARVETALASPGVPAASRRFVEATRELLAPHPHRTARVAAAFAFGREGVIPDMFAVAVRALAANDDGDACSLLVTYLERHIEVDGDGTDRSARARRARVAASRTRVGRRPRTRARAMEGASRSGTARSTPCARRPRRTARRA